jgi:hypothetical protein
MGQLHRRIYECMIAEWRKEKAKGEDSITIPPEGYFPTKSCKYLAGLFYLYNYFQYCLVCYISGDGGAGDVMTVLMAMWC